MADAGSLTRRIVLGLPIYIWLAVLVLAPNLLLLISSFGRSDNGGTIPGYDLQNYARLLDRSSYLILIWRTLATACAAAVCACLIGYPMAYYVSRHINRNKMVFVLLVIIPLWVSLLIRVFAWKIILGEQGVFNSFLLWSGLLDAPTQLLLYTRFTVFLTFTYVAIPYVFLTSYTALERIPNVLVEASRDCGAHPATTFRRVIWPLSRQGLMIGFSLAFLLGVGDYVSPSMVGGLTGTMAGMIIASQFGLAGNWPFGAALAVVLMIGVIAVLGIIFALARSRGVLESSGPATAIDFAAGGGRSLGGKVRRLGGQVLFGLCYVLLYGPMVIIVMFSFNDSTLQALPFAGFTTQWYAAMLDDANLLAALRRSLIVGFVVSAASAVIGTGFALVLARIRLPGGNSIGALLTLPVMLPGIVLGISLALTFHWFNLQSGIATVILGQMTFVVPVIMVVVRSRLSALDPSLEAASADLGAGPWMTFRRVLLPLIATAVIAGTLLGFTLSFDEVTVTLFLTGADPTLPVYIWNQLRFGFTPTVNAVFACIGFASLVLIIIASRLMTTSREGNRASLPLGATQ